MAIAPYRQGELDALCGLYAIINATRLALSGTKRMKSADCRDFFAFLTATLQADRLLLQAMTKGLHRSEVSRLITHADGWLQRRFGMGIRNERRHYLRPGASRLRVVHAIANHLAEPNASAMILVKVGPHHPHWTAVKKVTKTSLILFDAGGMKRVSLAHATRDAVRLRSRDVYLLRCEPHRAAIEVK